VNPRIWQLKDQIKAAKAELHTASEHLAHLTELLRFEYSPIKLHDIIAWSSGNKQVFTGHVVGITGFQERITSYYVRRLYRSGSKAKHTTRVWLHQEPLLLHKADVRPEP
jgi:hypothetical protein